MEPEVDHGETEVYTRVKLEAVRLIKDRGVSYTQAAQDLGVHQSQLQMKPKQLEIARLKREAARTKKAIPCHSSGDYNSFMGSPLRRDSELVGAA